MALLKKDGWWRQGQFAAIKKEIEGVTGGPGAQLIENTRNAAIDPDGDHPETEWRIHTPEHETVYTHKSSAVRAWKRLVANMQEAAQELNEETEIFLEMNR